MRRAVVIVVVLTLAAAGCSNRSTRSTDVPAVPQGLDDDVANVGVGACRLTFGPGFGALVQDVVASGPSDGLILPGDRIIDIDGVAVSTASGLVAAVQSHAVGEQITVRLVRDDLEPVIVDAVLAEHADDPRVPVLGVIVATAEEQQPVRVIEFDPTLGGELARVIRFDARYLVFDPISVRWSPLLGVSVAGGEAFVTSDDEIYQFDVTLDGSVFAFGALGGAAVPVAVDGWDILTSLTVIDGTLLVGAIRDDAGRDSGVETAVLGLDIGSGELLWAVVIEDQASGSFVPTSAARDPFRDRALIRMTPLGASHPESHLLLSVAEGVAVTTSVPGVPDGSLVVGWHDHNQLMWVESPQTLAELHISDVLTGTTGVDSLPEELAGAQTVWPVGNGAHVIVSDGEDLLFARVGTDDVRRITTDCTPAGMGDPGWAGLAG